MLKFMEDNAELCTQIAAQWKDKKEEEQKHHVKLATQYSSASGVEVNQIHVELRVPLYDILGHGEATQE